LISIVPVQPNAILVGHVPFSSNSILRQFNRSFNDNFAPNSSQARILGIPPRRCKKFANGQNLMQIDKTMVICSIASCATESASSGINQRVHPVVVWLIGRLPFGAVSSIPFQPLMEHFSLRNFQ
jgi:hypothetical protein